jgi:hypothetical protein
MHEQEAKQGRLYNALEIGVGRLKLTVRVGLSFKEEGREKEGRDVE